ncbi:MAG: DUF1145 domain-containing protein [Bacteroidales bacterium]
MYLTNSRSKAQPRTRKQLAVVLHVFGAVLMVLHVVQVLILAPADRITPPTQIR